MFLVGGSLLVCIGVPASILLSLAVSLTWCNKRLASVVNAPLLHAPLLELVRLIVVQSTMQRHMVQQTSFRWAWSESGSTKQCQKASRWVFPTHLWSSIGPNRVSRGQETLCEVSSLWHWYNRCYVTFTGFRHINLLGQYSQDWSFLHWTSRSFLCWTTFSDCPHPVYNSFSTIEVYKHFGSSTNLIPLSSSISVEFKHMNFLFERLACYQYTNTLGLSKTSGHIIICVDKAEQHLWPYLGKTH